MLVDGAPNDEIQAALEISRSYLGRAIASDEELRKLDRVLKETKVSDRFTEHDLRAKCASDADTLEHARALLSHADARTTEAIYRRKPERVKPLK
jgi:integrase